MKWARIENKDGKKIVLELTDINPVGRFHESLIWVPVSDNTKEYDEYDEISGQTHPPPPPPKEQVAAGIRSFRDSLLSTTDWTQAADIPQATKDKWMPYRQALRNIPEQEGFPYNIIWPDKPQ